jgi:hypothetical protein
LFIDSIFCGFDSPHLLDYKIFDFGFV